MPYQAESWHPDARPTAFLDGHVKNLVSMKYRYNVGGGTLAMGPYNTWGLWKGLGTPAHEPWDFWIDEY